MSANTVCTVYRILFDGQRFLDKFVELFYNYPKLPDKPLGICTVHYRSGSLT